MLNRAVSNGHSSAHEMSVSEHKQRERSTEEGMGDDGGFWKRDIAPHMGNNRGIVEDRHRSMHGRWQGTSGRQTSLYNKQLGKTKLQSFSENIRRLLDSPLQTPGNPQWFCSCLQCCKSFLLEFSSTVKPGVSVVTWGSVRGLCDESNHRNTCFFSPLVRELRVIQQPLGLCSPLSLHCQQHVLLCSQAVCKPDAIQDAQICPCCCVRCWQVLC